MRIAIVGAGVAGITAAHRLHQAGHNVEIVEARDVVGGRTHTEHLGSNHYLETGAAWLASCYPRTLALLDEVRQRDHLFASRAAPHLDSLLVHGQVRRFPFSVEAIATSALLSLAEKQALTAYLARLAVEQAGDLQIDLGYDTRDALAELTPLGSGAVDYALRPSFEGPFFTPLQSLSAAMVRAWLRALQGATFYLVEGGMDRPWRELAASLDVRLSARVEALRRRPAGVEVVEQAGVRRYDGVVLAVPAPEALRLLGTETECAPAWLSTVRYAPAIRVYAARPCSDDANFGVHVPHGPTVATVEYYAGRRGAWGTCPPEWQWGLVTASPQAAPTLLERPRDEVARALWAAGRAALPELFPLEQAEIVRLVRWPEALPIMAPGRYRQLAAFAQSPPIVLAGDWLQEACIEGAVRSGEAAAAAFGPAK